ncbi:calcineurin B-like protein 4 [Tanacetum coccineum]|uniref:Calcineurin B-like protein 4 n=1 Tax=Tanacetum coccineum TaxID=301880 RepID=A0ABQ4WBK2_9ASTR
MSKVLGSKKPYGRLPPKRGQVKLSILRLIIEIVKDMVNRLPEDNRNLEIGKSSRIDDKVVKDQRQRDDYDIQDEREDQPNEEEKRKADGTVDKYKPRLVIKGFRQREGLDYFDTYSLVTRITSIRMILAIAALRNLEVHQIDVKKAFLNEDLEEEIYMNQPEGFMAPRLESNVCRLVKSLYDLRKAPKQGHQISPYHVRMWIRN